MDLGPGRGGSRALTRLETAADSPYGFHNLPFGVFSPGDGPPRVGVRVGDAVVDLAVALADDTFAQPSLNPFMAQGVARWREVRARIQELEGGEIPAGAVHELAAVTLHLPVEIGDYVDFYCSEHHAANLGRLLRPGQPPLTPNWYHLPLGYHGRAGTVVTSGTPIRRPWGQRGGENGPVFGPSTRLDVECEVAFVIGQGSPMGTPLTPSDFDAHVFGVLLFNDWSARDIQAWESAPLGPHQGKSFASTVGAWVVPLLALGPARVPTPAQRPTLPYLHMDRPWGLDIDLQLAWNGQVVSSPRYRDIYWSPAQMLAQLTANGASTRPGDLFASGTVSGPESSSRGAFIELTWGGAEPLTVNGEARTFLADGDEVVITATAPGPGGARIGFGECRGRVVAAAPGPALT